MTAPWFPLDVDWWPAIAASLARPWPRSAILADLRWWSDQERIGRGARPGRPALAARWGVTDHAARVALRDAEAWSCPIHGDPMHTPGHHQRVASGSPAGRQPVASRDEDERRDLSDFRQPVASPSPADRQPVASSSPHARVYIEQIAETETETDQTHTRDDQRVTRSRRTRTSVDDQVARLWSHYRSRCPERRGETPPGYLARPLARAIADHGVDELEVLVDWLADAGGRAAYLRDGGYTWGETPWRPAKLPQYLDLAREWQARGRVDLPAPARVTRDAWGDQLRAARQRVDAEVITLPYHAPARGELTTQPPTTTTEDRPDDIPF